MNGAERRAAAHSASAAVREVNSTVADVETAVRDHVAWGLAPLGAAGRLPLTAIAHHSQTVHALIDLGVDAAGRVTGTALDITADPHAPSVDDRPLASVAALRAAFGDRLPRELAPETRFIGDTAGPHPESHDRLVIFVHGLGGHEDQWHPDYLSVAHDAGFSVLRARYTSGRSLTDSGAELAAAIADAVGDPGPDSRVVLVGHSMGGLIITEALRQSPDSAWADRVTDVITLGSPFRGAPLERFARTVLSWASRSSVAAPIVALGDHRSVGIKDLGDGLHGAPTDHDLRHHAVVASLGTHPRSLLSRLLGDGMVPQTSAASPRTQSVHAEHDEHLDGPSETRPRGGPEEQPDIRVHEVVKAHHLELLGHAEVTQVLTQVLQESPVGSAPTGGRTDDGVVGH